jgi:hypothetical protein
MNKRPIVIIGAGASIHSGLPGTAGLLPRAFQKEENREVLKDLDEFLCKHFHLPSVEDEQRPYPALPLLLGLLDDAISQEHHFSPKWDVDKLRHVRRLVEYAIYTVVGEKPGDDQPYYRRLLEWVAPADSSYEPTLISVNYDLLADDAFIETSRHRPGGVRFPEYGCDIATEEYLKGEKFGRLLKLYGSLHWLYCPACQRMDAAFYSKDHLASVVGRAFNAELLSEAFLPSTKGYACTTPHCESRMRPVLIAPSPMREYRIPHMAQVWYAAERALQQADRAIFIGYGIPWSDLQVIYILKRGLEHLEPHRIVVVLPPPLEDLELHQFESGQRYLDVFGQGLRWYPGRFEDWLEKVKDIPVAEYEG